MSFNLFSKNIVSNYELILIAEVFNTSRHSSHQRNSSFGDISSERHQVKTLNREPSIKKARKSDESSSSSSVMMTSLVSESEEFKAGDFVVLKDDIEKEGMQIWK